MPTNVCKVRQLAEGHADMWDNKSVFAMINWINIVGRPCPKIVSDLDKVYKRWQNSQDETTRGCMLLDEYHRVRPILNRECHIPGGQWWFWCWTELSILFRHKKEKTKNNSNFPLRIWMSSIYSSNGGVDTVSTCQSICYGSLLPFFWSATFCFCPGLLGPWKCGHVKQKWINARKQMMGVIRNLHNQSLKLRRHPHPHGHNLLKSARWLIQRCRLNPKDQEHLVHHALFAMND